MSQKKYNTGKLPKLWEYLVKLHETKPEAFSSPDYLKAHVAQVWKALGDSKSCPNCAASMAMYRRKIDYFIVTLVVSMGRVVKHNMTKTSFTEANQVHVNADERIPHNARNMTGIASALGLIAPVQNKEAHWLITSRGFAALRGEAVPAWVLTFRDEIIERATETVTFAEAMQRRKDPEERGVYDPNEWVEITSFHQSPVL